MSGAEPAGAITRQGIFTIWRGVLVVEPCLVPIFGVTGQYSCRKNNISSPLNGYPTQLKTKSIGHLILAAHIEIVSKEINLSLLLKIHFTEDLKVADVGNGVGTDVLRVKVVKVENIPEEF